MSDLDDYIAKRDQRSPGFKERVAAAEVRAETRLALGRLLRELRGTRSQTWIAAQMETSASVVRRIEQGEDVRISTLEKYANALGRRLHVELVD